MTAAHGETMPESDGTAKSDPRPSRAVMRRFFACLVVATALLSAAAIAGWARSHVTADRIQGPIWGSRSLLIASKDGRIAVVFYQWSGAVNWNRWHVSTNPVDDVKTFPRGPAGQYTNRLGFGTLRDPWYIEMAPNPPERWAFGVITTTLHGPGVIVPYWSMILLLAVFHLVCWLGWIRRVRTGAGRAPDAVDATVQLSYTQERPGASPT